MKRVISIILCLTMLFVMAAVPALAADGEGKWVELLNEDFTNRTAGESFDSEIKYQNATSYIYHTGDGSSNVTHTVSAYGDNKALKISKSAAGDKRILFKLNEALSGKFEISFSLLTTNYIAGAINVELFNEDRSTTITGTSVTTANKGTRFVTSYNNGTKTDNMGTDKTYFGNDMWLQVKYEVDTTTGDVVATYKYDTLTKTRTIASGDTAHVSSLPAVSGLSLRLQSNAVTDLYIDDILIKYYEEPAAAETEFDFEDIKGENASETEVTKALNLVSTFTDSETVAWNIVWSSSDEAVINSQTGAVNPAEVDKEVTLTATFTGSKTFTKVFTLTVPALLSEFDFSAISSESVNAVTSNLNLIDTFTDDAGSEWKVDWSSSDENIINSETGAVTAGGIDERVELTASLTNYGDGTESEQIVSRTFNVKVLAVGTYHIKEGFDATDDYSGLNAIKNYTGAYNLTWGVSNNYNAFNQYNDTSKTEDMNANISVDPENAQDKVLKLYRKATAISTIQRVWTLMNKDSSTLNDKVYVGMRVLREEGEAPTDIYAYDAAGNRLMYFRFAADNSLVCYYNSDLKSKTNNSNAVPLGEWFDVTVELDMKNGSYSVYINGKVIRTSLAMTASGGSFGGLMFDLVRNEDPGYTKTSTTYIDDLTVRTTGGFPYSVVEYNFTDADGYPTKSMVEGGKLKSIDMRKMSTVDAGTEPKLYVGFFKGEKLYDVISAPIDENGSLGGFEATLNKALPENVLDYSLKTFVFSKDLAPLMETSSYAPFPVIPTIFAAGDSLGEERSAAEYPQSGYVQELSAYVDEDEINIENHAISGRSSKSYYDEGSLDKVLAKMYSGDYLFIQFGHNDEDGKGEYRETDPAKGADEEGSYKWYLMKYIQGARDRGATPVLVTPPARNNFVDGELKDTRVQPYVDAMISLANAEGVALVDLNAGWKSFVEGEVAKNIDSRNFYACFYPNDARFVGTTEWTGSKYNVTSGSDYDKFYSCYVVNPDDANDTDNHIHHDGTHLNIYGARVAAKIIADSLAQSGLNLADSIVENRVAEYPWASYATFGTIEAR